MINIAYLNIRSLEEGCVRQLKLDILEEQLGPTPDVLLLAETKCQSKLARPGLEIFQTLPSARGGAIAQFKVPNARLVKAININIL
jgi:hypothetical protein